MSATLPTFLNDRHAQTNPTEVMKVVTPRDEEAVVTVLTEARRDGHTVSVGGCRHAMGGQQFRIGSIHLDMTRCNGLRGVDGERGVATTQAGICWRELIKGIAGAQSHLDLREQHGIRQKQTGANDLSLGGAVSANAHGRGLLMPPMIGDIESLRLVSGDGSLRVCNREENGALFRHVIGGYGLFGVVTEVTLRLSRRRKVRRVVGETTADEIMDRFRDRVAAGYLYGDFQFDIDPGSPLFLRRGVFSCYEPVDDATAILRDQRYFTESVWLDLVRLARSDKARAYRTYLEQYRATHGQIYYSDTHQLSTYTPDYAARINDLLSPELRGTEMITEVYVARHRLAEFLSAVAQVFRDRATPVTYGTVRLIEPDDESALPWARRYTASDGSTAGPACIVFNLLINPATMEERQEDFRMLIDLALAHGDGRTPGGFFLTYHRYARTDQLLTAYPELPSFLARRDAEPGADLFGSDWLDDIRHRINATA